MRFFLKFSLCVATLLSSYITADIQQLPTMYQISTQHAFAQGIFSSQLSVANIKRLGDFGFGSLNNLDGELIAIDGEYYHLRSNGKAGPLDTTHTVPFARCVRFNPGAHFTLQNLKGRKDVEHAIRKNFSSKNLLYAYKMQGIFSRVKLGVHREKNPTHKDLKEAKGEQNEYTLYDVKGTVVGFWTPSFFEPITKGGFQWYFITSDFSSGGRVLDISLDHVNVLTQQIESMQIILPSHDKYLESYLQHTPVK